MHHVCTHSNRCLGSSALEFGRNILECWRRTFFGIVHCLYWSATSGEHRGRRRMTPKLRLSCASRQSSYRKAAGFRING